MSLQDIINQLIQDEIKNDPQGIGYEGKTDDEVMKLLNSGVQRSSTNYYTEQTPISRILNGVGNAPNIIEVTDVSSAKVFVKPVPIEEVKPE